ncbi:CsgE family curli-type amyloid fiber assembly protein [Aequorivita sp. SDUM287046]|uniref:Curli production assembly/transport component CsgE n=1 Tax=Aequorivita aurantiaca TaxID=3053356 RepID=A0ABT8DH52_9FLAO|nr:CsgE family curli-type amyloid fiber assembly protein [Aequorivita aurantiaca]MDN3724623.1 CsgE family curli-type amyloid fiber assembly protein [Aequorivita aurantiaca]
MKEKKTFEHVVTFLILLISAVINAQFYNKDYVGKIYVKQDSEFFTFTATAENLTPVDVNLKYDFIIYKVDTAKNTSKNNQENLFFLKGNDKVALASTTISYNEQGKITLVLIIYDNDGKPVGQDRIELNSDGNNQSVPRDNQVEAENSDQALPQDGIILDGLVLEKTITKAGRDFYKYFYAEYYNRQIRTKKNIFIEEVPGRFRNTRISVSIDGQLLWQFFSQPNKSFLQSMATTALDKCILYLQQLQQQKTNSITHY